MCTSLPEHHPLRRLFAGTVQHVLYADVGLCDPQVVDYLVELLSRFIHQNDLHPFVDANGQRLETLAEMAADAHFPEEVSPRERRRMLHKHMGDFTLFWSGLFPEGVRRLPDAGIGTGLSDYVDHGKRSYALASELTRPSEAPPAPVLQRLSERFEHCMYGLNLCRKEWDALRMRNSGLS